MDNLTRQALEAGRANAGEVISFRLEALQHRAQALSGQAAVAETAVPQAALPEALAASGARPESWSPRGNSWFNYPWTDILRLLEDEHGYDVESAAHFGDTVEAMAYSGGQLERFSRLIGKSLRRGRTPKAILISGGGNDLAGAGANFGMLLDHARSAWRVSTSRSSRMYRPARPPGVHHDPVRRDRSLPLLDPAAAADPNSWL